LFWKYAQKLFQVGYGEPILSYEEAVRVGLFDMLFDFDGGEKDSASTSRKKTGTCGRCAGRGLGGRRAIPKRPRTRILDGDGHTTTNDDDSILPVLSSDRKKCPGSSLFV